MAFAFTSSDAFAAPPTTPPTPSASSGASGATSPTSSVLAGATTREEEAREAVRRGFAAFARGDAKAALEEYQRAQALVPEANLPYRYAAEALAKLGRTEEVIASLEKYLSLKPDVSDAAATRVRIEELRKTLPSHVTLECSPVLPNIAVRVDGGAAASYSCPADLLLAPGEHSLAVRAEGKRENLLKITTSAGATIRLSVALEDGTTPTNQGDLGTPTDKGARAPGAAGSGSPLRTLGYVALGVGAAALVTSLVVDLGFLGPAIDDFHAAADRPTNPEGSSAADLHAKVETLRVVSIIGYASAAAFATTGAVLLLVAPSRSPSASTRARTSIGVTPNGVRATLVF